ncbi:MAG: hypothetical protein J6331_03100 [Lentisphaeria bacterium]|nr:hypothetical protein [Lentisphaeria bacterium]
MWRERALLFREIGREGGEYLSTPSGIVSKLCPRLDPAELLAAGRLVKDSRTVTAGINGGYFIKRYNRKSLWNSLKRVFQLPRAKRCLAGALKLEKAGIPTPHVLYADRSFLVTESLGGSMEEFSLCVHREWTMDFVPTLVKMHEEGIFHGDLSLRNIYRTKEGFFGLIDLDSVVLYPGKVPLRRQIGEMARLVSSYCLLSRIADAEGALENFLKKHEEAGGPVLPREKVLKKVRYYIGKTDMRWLKDVSDPEKTGEEKKHLMKHPGKGEVFHDRNPSS